MKRCEQRKGFELNEMNGKDGMKPNARFSGAIFLPVLWFLHAGGN